MGGAGWCVDLGRKVLGLHDGARRERHYIVDSIDQFAYIAGPFVCFECSYGADGQL